MTALQRSSKQVGMYQGFSAGILAGGSLLLVIPAVIGWGWEIHVPGPSSHSLCLVAFMFQGSLKPAPSDSPRPFSPWGVFLVRRVDFWCLPRHRVGIASSTWGTGFLPFWKTARKKRRLPNGVGRSPGNVDQRLGRMSGGLVLLRSPRDRGYGSLLILAAILLSSL